MRRLELTGQRFGKLVVIAPSGVHRDGHTLWLCRCDCGNEIVVKGNSLKRGTSSCGCLIRENLTKHGHHGERLYGVWKGIRTRCNNPENHIYKYYGGKGVRMCSEWDDYGAFREWAIANGYDPHAPRGKCTIDRIDPGGDYEPGNCRFVDMHVQRVNQSRMKEA